MHVFREVSAERENALFVDVNDATKFGDAMIELVQDLGLRKRLGRRVRAMNFWRAIPHLDREEGHPRLMSALYLAPQIPHVRLRRPV